MNKPNKSLEEIQKKLEKGIQETMNNEHFKKWLKVVSSFHQYSYNNTILICSQNSEATLVKGYQDWKKIGRQVKRGEKAIKILAPLIGKRNRENGHKKTEKEQEEKVIYGFRYVNVFDIQQTEGKDMPKNPAELLEGGSNEQAVLKEWIQKINIPVVFKDTGNANGYFRCTDNTIALNAKRNALHQMKTLVHEFAHYLLHGNGAEFERENRKIKEAQAESVAYVVMNYFGYDTGSYSFAYISGWSQDINVIERIGQDILECSRKLIDTLGNESMAQNDPRLPAI